MELALSIAGVLRRWLRWSKSPIPPPLSDPAALGRWGEDRAADFLRVRGYKILYRNYRAKGGGELDIVSRYRPESLLCFAEVKTRRLGSWGRPADAVDEEKRKLIFRGAASWLRLLDHPDIRFRFDIIEIIAQEPPSEPEIHLLPGAFHLPGNVFY